MKIDEIKKCHLRGQKMIMNDFALTLIEVQVMFQ